MKCFRLVWKTSKFRGESCFPECGASDQEKGKKEGIIDVMSEGGTESLVCLGLYSHPHYEPVDPEIVAKHLI